jgi:hypothetical protein
MWRRQLVSGLDQTGAALRAMTRSEIAPRIEEACGASAGCSPYRMARLAVPFVGDGIPAGGAFSIRPEFSSFA